MDKISLPKINRFDPRFAPGHENLHQVNPRHAKYVNTSGLPIVHWRNAKVYVEGVRILDYPKVNDKYFFIPLNSQNYHFLVDSVSVFLYAKSFDPDLKPYVLISHGEKMQISQHPEYKKLKELGFADEDIHLGVETPEPGQHNWINFFHLYTQSFDIPNPHSLYFFDELYDVLREKYYKKICDVSETRTKKYYASRSRSRVRSLENEHLLEEYFSKIGYETIYLEEMSFSEQAYVFLNSHTVITRSGSALANMIFASPKTRIIEIGDHLGYRSDSIEWKTMADKFGLDYVLLYVGNTKDARYIIKRLNQYMFNL